jgi:NADH-quinone oxidoreductase subunit L
MHEEQDVMNMGGLKSKMKVTFLTFLMGGIAISGIPPFSGFFSKDEILTNVYLSGNYVWFGLGLITAFMTAFYIFRLIGLTFYGKPRYDENHVHPHESPKVMTIPLIILALLSVIGGFIGLPHIIGPNFLDHFLEPVFAGAKGILPEHHIEAGTEVTLILVSVVVAAAAIFLSFRMFAKEFKSEGVRTGLYKVLQNKYYVDEIYNAVIVMPLRRLSDLLYKFFDVVIIDGIVNGSGRFFMSLSGDWRKVQTGVIQDYAIISVAGIIAIILFVLLM